MSVWGMIRLGASVQENALATLTDLLGDPTAVDHKPARADIQKYKNAYDLFNGTYDKDGGRTGDPVDPKAAQEWDDKYVLSMEEKVIVSEYQKAYQVLDEDPQRAFTQTLAILRADGFDLDDTELKKLVGGALKKYEQQNYPMLYAAIRQALDDAYRRGPYESYKMWPRMVQWIKDRFEGYLWILNGDLNPRDQSWRKLEEVSHYVDIATEGGAVLSQLRAENKLPHNFDANQLSAGDFEKWLMDWKKANRESEAQGQVVYEFKDGWTIQKLSSPESLQFEGDEMGHCVGSYHHRVDNGDTIIYSLRDKSSMPHVTMEVRALEGLEKLWKDGEEIPEDASYNIGNVHPEEDPSGYVRYEDRNYERFGPSGQPGEPKITPLNEESFKIVQVQGQANKTPKPEYRAKIKEFLDAMRAKGWKFERSESWYGNWDDERADGYDPEYPERIDDARSLDDWWDDHYLPQHSLYRTQENRQDDYGMDLPSERTRPGVYDWSDVIESIAGSLMDDGDQGKFRINWATAAQQVYHAWVSDMSQDDPDEQYLAQETKSIESEIEGVEEKITDWEHDNEYYALNDPYMSGQVAEKLKEKMEKKGEWEAFMKQVEAEHGQLEDPEFDEYETGDILTEAQEYDPDLYYEIIHEEINKYYSENAYKFTQYLYMLVQKQGMVGPNDLPDPNQRHGGLPSYDELLNMDWKSEVNRLPTEPEIPGTFSHWHEAMADRSGIPEIDNLIEDFLKEPYDEYGDTGESFRDPEQAHGNCQAVTEKFVEFAKARGFKAYSTDTDIEEMGYKPSVEPFGEIGFDENEEMQYGFYPEHTVASIYLEGQSWPIIIDFTATQYGYTDHPKMSNFSKVADFHDWIEENAEPEDWMYQRRKRKFNVGDLVQVVNETAFKGYVGRVMRVEYEERSHDQWLYYLSTPTGGEFPFSERELGQPGHTASADDIQIHPIDQEHNTWLDEDGNEVRRWRPGWVKNPETGKMEQTGEPEDSFLDNKGRQANGYVAYHGDRPVGSLTYIEEPAWNMLGTAYTHPDYRQQGIFNRLAQPLRDSGKPIDAYVWHNQWLKSKVRDWLRESRMPKEEG